MLYNNNNMHKRDMHNIIINDNENKLNSEWNLYFHDPNSYNWNKESYYKIYTLRNIVDYWILNKEIRIYMSESSLEHESKTINGSKL